MLTAREETGKDCSQNNPGVHRVAPPRVAGPDVCSHGRKADFCCLLGGVCCSGSELHQLKSSWACALGCRHGHCLLSLVHGQEKTDKLKGANQTLWIATPGCPKMMFRNIEPVAKFSLAPWIFVLFLWAMKGCAVLGVGFPWGNGEDSIQIKWLVSLCSQWGEISVSRMGYLLVPSAAGV